MKALFLSFFIMMTMTVGTAQSSVDPIASTAKTVVLGVISEVPRSDFESRVQEVLQGQMRSCSSCEIRNLTPYTSAGDLDRAALAIAVEKAPEQAQVLYIGWNEISTSQTQAFLAALKKVTASGVILIGPAGEPVAQGPSHSLNKTVLGQVPDAIIIGELNNKESLARRSFYGPEMLTALKPPKGIELPGVAPSQFATRLVVDWKKKDQDEWVAHFRARKSLSRRIWPGLDEFFR